MARGEPQFLYDLSRALDTLQHSFASASRICLAPGEGPKTSQEVEASREVILHALQTGLEGVPNRVCLNFVTRSIWQ